MMLRIDPATVEVVQACAVPFTQAVEEGLALWLAREKRRKAEARPRPAPRAPRKAA
jgi:hypothetical protein